MIASLRGILFQKLPESLIVEVGGVGYEVYFPQSGHDRLPGVGEEVFLHIQAVIREDAFNLYGFLEPAEKEMFQLLNTVSGIGPKLAMHILAGISSADLARAILHDELARLTRLPGVGKKTAERLCLELKDKVRFVPEALSVSSPGLAAPDEDARVHDALSALLNLGYPAVRAREALAIVRQQAGAEAFAALRLEELLRQTLRALV
ncbi:MAG: Holliday junction DNA helicase RuvA [Deltaproteobacteria bacterium RIFOXYD12_FULL_55_16]|nr:MAG: Holliday junction DNA helicase RuvA [Deltaproteobacteria bacterium RIFOXYD12_FULL_55_16]